MWTLAAVIVAFVSMQSLVSDDSSRLGLEESPKVALTVSETQRIGPNEVRFQLKITNTSSAPVYSTGISFEPTDRVLTVYVEQRRKSEEWQPVAPCQDLAPPHVITLDPAVPMVEELTLKVPLSRICKKRDIQLEGQFRFRVDYFESKAQAELYLEKFFAENGDKPRPFSAYSEPFEIPPFRDPSEAGPNH